MRHQHFRELLSHASVHDGQTLTPEERACRVRVQWDPERTPALGMLPYRSIQIGVGRGIVKKWVDEWVEGIEDVTEMARGLKQRVDEGGGASVEELVGLGLVPEERVYELPEELRAVLKMDVGSS